MIHRYFHITEWQYRTPTVVCEYFGDFGYWSNNMAANKYKLYVKGQMWHFFSDLPITLATAEKSVLILESRIEEWRTVNMVNVSSPITLRIPAMGRKRR